MIKYILICLIVLLPESLKAFEIHPEDSLDIEFNQSNVNTCLQKARGIMARNHEILTSLREFIENPEVDYADLRQKYPLSEYYFAAYGNGEFQSGWIPKDVFWLFEGGWQGHWEDLEVFHIWFSIAWNLQFVVLSDSGVLKNAINYIDPSSGVICGIVDEPGGERLHEGKFFLRPETIQADT